MFKFKISRSFYFFIEINSLVLFLFNKTLHKVLLEYLIKKLYFNITTAIKLVVKFGYIILFYLCILNTLSIYQRLKYSIQQ